MGAGSVANCQYGEGNECYVCKYGYLLSDDLESCVQFPGCEDLKDGDNTKCRDCEDGYALSSDQSKCIKFEGCKKLVEGDNTKCDKCNDHFHLNKDGKCERTLCEIYDNKDVCEYCYSGYYLNKEKNCEEITVQNCLRVDENNNTKCTSCEGGYYLDEGQCVLPSTLIKGCIKYDKAGKCTACGYNYEVPKNDGTCTFKACENNKIKMENCYACKKGYYMDDDGLCTNYVDGSKDTSFSSRKSVDYSLLILILGLLI